MSIGITIFLATSLVVFALLEVGVRLYYWHSSDFSRIVQKDSFIEKRYKEDLDMTMTSYESGLPVHIKTNTLGFSGEEPTKEREGDTVRIAHLGDSFTAAMEVDYEKKYTELLRGALSPVVSGKTVESYNFGVGGQGTKQALKTYRQYVTPYSPDIVVLWFYEGNDFEENLRYDEEQKSLNESSLLKKIFRHSALARLVVVKVAQVPYIAEIMRGKILVRVGDDSGADANDLPLHLRLLLTENEDNARAIDRTREYMTDLAATLRADGVEFYVVIIPAHYQVDLTTLNNLLEAYPGLRNVAFDASRRTRTLTEMLSSLGIAHLDLKDAFITQCLAGSPTPGKGCGLYFCESCHLSDTGHAVAAEKTALFLEPFLQR